MAAHMHAGTLPRISAIRGPILRCFSCTRCALPKTVGQLNQIYLGNEDFVEQMQSLVDEEKELSEVPSSQMRPMPKTLDYFENQSHDRNSAIISSYRSGGYTLKELGDYFGLHYSTVSGIIRNHKSKT